MSKKSSVAIAELKRKTALPTVAPNQYPVFAALLQSGDESIATFASNCTTPKTDFDLGETVCIKVTGASAGSKRVNWVARTGAVVQWDDLSLTGPNTFSYTLPATQTATLSGTGVDDVTVDNRGVWRIYTAAPDNSVRTVASFTVHAPTPYVDLSVYQSVGETESSVSAESSSVFNIYLTNNGPDAAQDVQLTDTLPDNTTFVSLVDDSSAFNCSTPSGDTATCTASNPIPSGATVKFTLAYEVNSGTAADTVLTNNVAVTSTTAELEPGDNSSAFNAKVPASTGVETCTFDCPANVTATATSSSGAIVTFGSATGINGNCGAISASPASGSLFPVGTTVVNVSSDGGHSCSFTVTVVDTPAPTISCPSDKTATADSSGTATVVVGAPTTTPSTDVTVTGVRSDNMPLTDPYPTGVTVITWTVTDAAGRTASCTQRITVHAPCATDTQPPTITAPPDITIGTGPTSNTCGVALDDELGSPDAHDDCSVTVTTTGIPAGNFFPIGQTTITYTATDGAGHTASATQKVTVVDDTLPIIAAPADASYTCLSEVPAANPSQAHGTDPNLPNGGPPTDNCGSPTVTVSESSTGAGSASSPKVITRTFTATDAHGNTASAVQTITVIDPTPPTLTLNGADPMTVECHTGFTDPGATASDNCSSGAAVTSSGTVNPNTPGTYVITYTATDAAGNSTTRTRTVNVVDTTAPVITLNGANPMTVECHTSFTDPGATASDSCDTSVAVSASGSVNVNVPGTYTITYTAHDASNNTATPKTRTVNVVDTIAPTITLKSQTISLWPPNHKYTTVNVTDLVQSVSDSCDGGVSISNVVITKVTSDETENGNGDGNTTNDIVIASNCKSVQLRSERDGGGDGRVYTVYLRLRDATGNTTTVTKTVVVPANQGNGSVVDSGPHYTVTSSCQ